MTDDLLNFGAAFSLIAVLIAIVLCSLGGVVMAAGCYLWSL